MIVIIQLAHNSIECLYNQIWIQGFSKIDFTLNYQFIVESRKRNWTIKSININSRGTDLFG